MTIPEPRERRDAPGVINLADEAATAELAKTVASVSRPGDVIALWGDLGAGKTCFIQGLCSGLGVEEPVTSPTFTLINEYRGRLPVAHFDLYRLNDPESVLDIGFDEYIDSNQVCLIEWADKFLEIMPADAIEVRIEIGEGERRKLVMDLAMLNRK